MWYPREMSHRFLVFHLAVLAAVSTWAHPQKGATIGSEAGARVAVEMPEAPADRRELTYVSGPLSQEQVAELRELAPNVRIITVRSREEVMSHAADAHGMDGRFASEEVIAAAPHLAWVQVSSAGVERYLENKALVENERIVLTNMRAVTGPTIADHSFAMLLMLTRNMRVHEAAREQHRWGGPGSRSGIALEGRTLFVVGLGGIGSEIARRGDGFGMRIIASRRSDAPAPDYVDRVGKPDELLEMLGDADVVAIAVPLTRETDGLFDEEAFAAMKPGSYLINVARGRIVRTDALVRALQSGHLAGACLDVTDPEPLPPDHELWKMDNVIITPHTAGVAELSGERRWAVFRENIRRFGAGEPLLNTVDKEAGY